MPKVLVEQIIDTLKEAQAAYSKEEHTTEALLWLEELKKQPDLLPPLIHALLARILMVKEISLEDRKLINDNKQVLRNALDYLKNFTKKSFGGTTVGRVTSYAPYGLTSRGIRGGGRRQP